MLDLCLLLFQIIAIIATSALLFLLWSKLSSQYYVVQKFYLAEDARLNLRYNSFFISGLGKSLRSGLSILTRSYAPRLYVITQPGRVKAETATCELFITDFGLAYVVRVPQSRHTSRLHRILCFVLSFEVSPKTTSRVSGYQPSRITYRSIIGSEWHTITEDVVLLGHGLRPTATCWAIYATVR